jgi:hypothetical protein
MREDCVGRGDAFVASKRQVKPAAHAVAPNSCEHRLSPPIDRAEQRLAQSREFVGVRGRQLGQFLDVGASSESAFASRDHSSNDVRGTCDSTNFAIERGQEISVEARIPIFAFERENKHVAVLRG